VLEQVKGGTPERDGGRRDEPTTLTFRGEHGRRQVGDGIKENVPGREEVKNKQGPWVDDLGSSHLGSGHSGRTLSLPKSPDEGRSSQRSKRFIRIGFGVALEKVGEGMVVHGVDLAARDVVDAEV
jgi:hypothetical protein